MVKKLVIVLGLVSVIAATVFGVGWFMHVSKSKPEPTPLPTESTVKYKVPETTPTGVALNTEEEEVSEQQILDTFDTQILDLCTEVFGNYDESLKQLYNLILDAGYEYVTQYPTDTENIVTDVNMAEFTVYLPGARARAKIMKVGDSYETTLRFLEDGELETERFYEDEED